MNATAPKEAGSFYNKSTDTYDVKILDDQTFKDYLITEYYSLQDAKWDEAARWQNITINDNNTEQAIAVLGFSSKNAYIEFSKTQYKRYTELDKKYGISKFSEGSLENLIVDGLIKFNIPDVYPNTTFMSCIAKKRWCDVGVVSGAVLLHAGCAALDVETLGLTLVLGCHAAAFASQAAGHAGCIAAYEDCIAAQNN